MQPVEISDIGKPEFTYSICTLVTPPEQYRMLVDSMRGKGFDSQDCEFLYIDNTKSNKYDAYSGINKFLQIAKGAYIVICHQDVLLLSDGRGRLDQTIRELSDFDPNWGLFGNVGGIDAGRLAIRISDPHGEDQFAEFLASEGEELGREFHRCAKRRESVPLA